MKQLKTLFLSILFLIALIPLSACKEDSDAVLDSSSETNQETVSEISDFDYPDHFIDDTPSFGLKNYTEYLEFINKTELPESFVSYDMLQNFGSFRDIVFCENANNLKYRRYLYSFLDHRESRISLYVYNEIYEPVPPKQLITDINPNDMRRTVSSEYGSYFQNGVEYVYICGEISSVRWKTNDIAYVLSFNSTFDLDSPLDMTSAVGKMLNLEAAADQLAEFERTLPQGGEID